MKHAFERVIGVNEFKLCHFLFYSLEEHDRITMQKLYLQWNEHESITIQITAI